MYTLNKILELMEENNCDNKKLATALKLDRQVVTDWKAGRSQSYKKYLPQIAEFFQTDIEEFFEEDSEPNFKRYGLILATNYKYYPNQNKITIKEFEYFVSFDDDFNENINEEYIIDFINCYPDDVDPCMEQAIANLYIEYIENNGLNIKDDNKNIIANYIKQFLTKIKLNAKENSFTDTLLKKIPFEKIIENTNNEKNLKIEKIKSNSTIIDNKNIFMIPIYESVSAGFGSMPQDNIVDYTPLYFRNNTEIKNTICIKVKGDSMIPDIRDGDIIQVYKTDSIDSNTLGIVLIDGEEALVKKIVYGYGWIELQSLNPDYPTIRFEKEETNRIKILGQVKKIIRNV